MIRRIVLCYVFLAFVLLMQAEARKNEELNVQQWSQE